LDFVYLTRTTGEKIGQAIISLLNKNGLSIEDIRGQAYDGASSMSSNNVGVQSQIKKYNPLAIYTHCRSHILNLAISGTCKTQYLRNIIGVINELFSFFNFSPKRQRYLEFILKRYAPENKIAKLKGLCRTRWVERHDCLESLVSLYKYIATCLHSMVSPHLYSLSEEPENNDWNWDRETLIKAEGLRCSLANGTNIAALVILKNGLQSVKSLSVKLQRRDSDISEAYSYIDFAINEVVEKRNNIDSIWLDWFEEASLIAEDVGGTMDMPRTTKLQKNRSNVQADTPRLVSSNFYFM